MGRRMSDEAGKRHQQMVDDLVERRLVRSVGVEAAFRAVPRHAFLPGVALDEVYRDDVVVTRYNEQKQAISSSSQPAMMATMLEMLDVQAGQRVLEIGAGTGYNAALLAQMVGAAGQVVTIDYDEDIVADARQHLEAAGYGHIVMVCDDGANGYAAFAPYDRIILSVGAEDIAPAWVQQLTEGGLLLLPLTLRCAPRVIAFRRDGEALHSVGVTMGGFMPLRGSDAPPEHYHAMPDSKAWSIWHDGAVSLDMAAVAQTLDAPTRDFATGAQALSLSHWHGWSMWLELHDAAFALAYYRQGGRKPSMIQTAGLLESAAAALVVPSEGAKRQPNAPFRLMARCFGDSDALAERLVAHLRAWKAAGSPMLTDELQVDAHPLGRMFKLRADARLIRKRHMQYIVQVRRGEIV
jgi:protein-L-isoaspartate(D-aspartate) O-methyltransferase